MKLSTELLFFSLIKILKPDLVCDIGALDASTSLFVRKLLPHARVIAFEANPNNFALIKENISIYKNRIKIEQKAVWNKNMPLFFYLEQFTDESDMLHRGWSSTRKRTENCALANEKTKVVGIRLDTYVLNLKNQPKNIALWIDVEGGSYEVVEGMSEIRNLVKLVSLEVETKEVWLNQKLESSVIEIMKKMDFILIAQGFNEHQHDLIFLDKNVFLRKQLTVKGCMMFACFFGYFLRFFKMFGAIAFRKIGNF